MWSTRAELEAALRDAGLAEWAPRLAESARHCVILIPGPIDEAAAAPLGASRLGGEPDLPPDLDWPMRPPFSGGAFADHSRRPWPLSFVAQIDFAEIPAVHPLDGFPRAGRLLLFSDPIDPPWGTREDQARLHVVFTSVPTEHLQRRRHPRELDAPGHRLLSRKDFVFKPRILRPASWLLPPPDAYARQARAWPPQEWTAWPAYQKFWDDLYAGHPEAFGRGGERIHQVGGAAFSIQDPVEAECVKFADEPPRRKRWWQELLGSGAVSKAQHAARLERSVEWQLVLQIDSDIEAGMQWGDVGRLYLCVRRHDLAARRFDRCWMVTQCY